MSQKIVLFFLLLISLFPALNAQKQIPDTLSTEAKISVLTSAPWPEEVYAVFGHSSIRIYDPTEKGIDVVFNYGLFDFRTSNFIYRFMAGETDYMVGATYYEDYIEEYQSRGVDVYEQVINLTKEEKQRVWSFLLTNLRPENSVYRYNIFYNNCTTKLRDIIENNIDGKIIYSEDKTIQSYRDLIHEHVNQQPWLQFGIDIVIGNRADKPLTVREKIFLPAYEMNIFDHSIIQNNDGMVKPLVYKDKIVIPANQKESIKQANILTPIVIGVLILVLTILISIYEYRKGKSILGKIIDTLLFFVAGVAGCIITFMMFFSVHPCTSSNWNIIWLNPFELMAAFLFFAKRLSKYVYYYHFINFATLTLFLLAWSLIPQQLEIAFVPFALCIWLRSGMYLSSIKKMNKKAVKQPIR